MHNALSNSLSKHSHVSAIFNWIRLWRYMEYFHILLHTYLLGINYWHDFHEKYLSSSWLCITYLRLLFPFFTCHHFCFTVCLKRWTQNTSLVRTRTCIYHSSVSSQLVFFLGWVNAHVIWINCLFQGIFAGPAFYMIASTYVFVTFFIVFYLAGFTAVPCCFTTTTAAEFFLASVWFQAVKAYCCPSILN